MSWLLKNIPCQLVICLIIGQSYSVSIASSPFRLHFSNVYTTQYVSLHEKQEEENWARTEKNVVQFSLTPNRTSDEEEEQTQNTENPYSLADCFASGSNRQKTLCLKVHFVSVCPSDRIIYLKYCVATQEKHGPNWKQIKVIKARVFLRFAF